MAAGRRDLSNGIVRIVGGYRRLNALLQAGTNAGTMPSDSSKCDGKSRVEAVEDVGEGDEAAGIGHDMPPDDQHQLMEEWWHVGGRVQGSERGHVQHEAWRKVLGRDCSDNNHTSSVGGRALTNIF